MVDKSTDHGKLLSICFYNNIDGRYPFPFKFLGKSRAREKKKNELPHHHVISTICTLIEHSYPSISAREIARLLKKKKKISRPASFPGSLCFPSLQERGRRESGKEVVLGDLTNVYQQSAIMKGCVNMKVNIVICWE